MKRLPTPSVLIAAWMFATASLGAENLQSDKVSMATSALAVALSRADVALARSAIRPNLLKGNFGESHMHTQINRYLQTSGGWKTINARIGVQGLDGLYLRFDLSGSPSELMVSEAKYGSSRLGKTRDGIQLGRKWTTSRLGKLAATYRQVGQLASSGRMTVQAISHPSPAQRLQVPFRDGRAAVFWRNNSRDPWKFVGPRNRLQEAGERIGTIGNFLGGAAKGEIDFDTILYRVKLKSNALEVVIKDARNLETIGSEARLPVKRNINIPLRGQRLEALKKITKKEIANSLEKAFPNMARREALLYAESIAKRAKDFEAILNGTQRSVLSSMAEASVMAGFIGATLDVTIVGIGQSLEGSLDIDYLGRSAGVSFVSVGSGVAVGQGVTVWMMNNPTVHRFANHAASTLGFGTTSVITNGAGMFSGASVTSLMMAYGGYFLGLHDLKTANQLMIANAAGLTAGALAAGSAWALVAAYGTASTGTTIAGLNGAAASSAIAAWFGGGSLAAGGGGMATGSVVFSAGAAIVVIGVAAVTMYGLHCYDAKQETNRISLKIADLSKRKGYFNGHRTLVGTALAP